MFDIIVDIFHLFTSYSYKITILIINLIVTSFLICLITYKNLLFLPITIFTTGFVPSLIADNESINEEITPYLKVLRAFLPIEFLKNTTPLPDVNLPTELSPGQYEDELFNIIGTSSIKIVLFAIEEFLAILFTLGQKKYNNNGDSNFNALSFYQKIVVYNAIPENNSNLPSDFKYFGVYDGVGNLNNMMKYNPLFASALSIGRRTGVFSNQLFFQIDPYRRLTLGAKNLIELAKQNKCSPSKYLKVEKTLVSEIQALVDDDTDNVNTDDIYPITATDIQILGSNGITSDGDLIIRSSGTKSIDDDSSVDNNDGNQFKSSLSTVPIFKTTRFTELTESLRGDVYRVYAEFEFDPNYPDTLIVIPNSMKVYKGRFFLNYTNPLDNKQLIEVDKSGRAFTDSDKAYMLMFTLLHYAQNIHSTTHVLHQLLTSSLSRATMPYPDLHEWAKVYNCNLAVKYQEVAAVLYVRNGFYNNTNCSLFSGFHAGPISSVLKKTANLLHEMAECTTTEKYINGFLFKSCSNVYDFLNLSNSSTASNYKALKPNPGIAIEFCAQAGLVNAFATELDAQLMKVNSTAHDKVNTTFSNLTKSTGNNGIGNSTTVKQFIVLMSTSGLLHGSVASLTRLSATTPMLALINPKQSYITVKDFNYLVLMGNTVLGVTDGFSVFSSRLPYKKVPYDIIKILVKYEGLSNSLKSSFYAKITGSTDQVIQDNFLNFGFIMSDHFPDGIDGKQYTITAYV